METIIAVVNRCFELVFGFAFLVAIIGIAWVGFIQPTWQELVAEYKLNNPIKKGWFILKGLTGLAVAYTMLVLIIGLGG